MEYVEEGEDEVRERGRRVVREEAVGGRQQQPPPRIQPEQRSASCRDKKNTGRGSREVDKRLETESEKHTYRSQLRYKAGKPVNGQHNRWVDGSGRARWLLARENGYKRKACDHSAVSGS